MCLVHPRSLGVLPGELPISYLLFWMSQVPLDLLKVKVTDPGLGLPFTKAVWLQGAIAISPLTEGLQTNSSLMPLAPLMASWICFGMLGQRAFAAFTLFDSKALFQRCSRRSLMSRASSPPPD